MYSMSCWSCWLFFTTSGREISVCVETRFPGLNEHADRRRRETQEDRQIATHLSDSVDHGVQQLKLILTSLLVGLVDYLL